MGIELRGLAGKKVLVTGASKGQGFNHAKAFAEAGCDVAILDITHPIPDIYELGTPELMVAAVKAIEDRGQRAVALPCDIRDEEQVKAAVGKALEAFGGVINVIVNNAGAAALDFIHTMRSSTLHAVLDTNIKGTMFVTKYACDNMIGRREGKIINISSAVTGSGHAMLSHYVASKHAVNGLTAAWAMELAEFNINVNAIAPATIRPGEIGGSIAVQREQVVDHGVGRALDVLGLDHHGVAGEDDHAVVQRGPTGDDGRRQRRCDEPFAAHRTAAVHQQCECVFLPHPVAGAQVVGLHRPTEVARRGDRHQAGVEVEIVAALEPAEGELTHAASAVTAALGEMHDHPAGEPLGEAAQGLVGGVGGGGEAG